MLFLADMGISPNTVKWLQENNHDAIHLMDEGLHRAPDPFILEKAKKENRVIITSDLGFGHLMATSGDKFPSIIILRLNLENSKIKFI
jgi:predicted nuclease of predicted toxin-antitoxin system